MTPEKFVDWFAGFAERSSAPPTPAEWSIVVAKLATVFEKVTVKTVNGPSAPFGVLPAVSESERICSPLGGGAVAGGKLCDIGTGQTYCASPQPDRLTGVGGYALLSFTGDKKSIKSPLYVPSQWPETKLYSVIHTC